MGRFLAQEGSFLLSPWSDLRWRTDYNSARKEAQEKRLPIIIDFGTADCFWCRKLDDTTFRDPRVVGLLNERFVPLKIDADRDAALANHLRVESYPTLVIATSEGKILAYIKGYKDAEEFHGILQRVLIGIQPPESLQRDFDIALQKIQAGHYAAAIPMLKTIQADPKAKAIQPQVQKYLDAIEQKAMDRVTIAREMEAKGKSQEALDSLEETIRFYPGLDATRHATIMVSRIKEVVAIEKATSVRGNRAKEILAQMREFQKQRELVACLDRCSVLMRDYPDLPEGQEALAVMNELKANPALLQQAAEALSERLGDAYLAIAESHLQKGQGQRAEYYLQRVILACPGSRQAESAQVRLMQMQNAVTAIEKK
jgi:thioredoxin-related protein